MSHQLDSARSNFAGTPKSKAPECNDARGMLAGVQLSFVHASLEAVSASVA